MAATKRYRDGDKLRAKEFNAILNNIDSNTEHIGAIEASIETIKKSIPKKTSQLVNDSGFITKDNNTWRPIKVDGTEILGSGINTKPLNLVPGDGIIITHDNNGNVKITSIGGGGTSYIAGENINIDGDVISAVDTKYTASDFDIKDLADSTGLRDEWSGKQDPLNVTPEAVVEFLSGEEIEI